MILDECWFLFLIQATQDSEEKHQIIDSLKLELAVSWDNEGKELRIYM